MDEGGIVRGCIGWGFIREGVWRGDVGRFSLSVAFHCSNLSRRGAAIEIYPGVELPSKSIQALS